MMVSAKYECHVAHIAQKDSESSLTSHVELELERGAIAASAAQALPSSLCFALLCFALFCFALLCFALLCFALLCFALLCFALPCFVGQCQWGILKGNSTSDFASEVRVAEAVARG
jgi:hypothetical protein